MIKESIKELISAIAEGDTIAIEDSFNSVMSYKIADRLDSMRVDVAQTMFGSVVEELDENYAYSLKDSGALGMHAQVYSRRDKTSPWTKHANHLSNTGGDKGRRNIEQILKKKYGSDIQYQHPSHFNEEFTLEDYSLEELEDFMMSEDFEQLDELSKSTLGSYISKATNDVSLGGGMMSRSHYEPGNDKHQKQKIFAQGASLVSKRKTGINSAIGKLTKEEFTLEDYSVKELEDFMMSEDFEQLDELSRKTLSSYIGKARSSKSNALKDLYKDPEGSDERDKNRKTANNRTDGKERAIDTLRGKTNKDRAKKGLPTRYYTEEVELEEAVTASQLIANHNSSDHGGAQHFSNVDGTHHSWNYVKKNKEGTKYEVTPDKGEAEGIAHKGKFLKLKK
jgi:hypothetical protein